MVVAGMMKAVAFSLAGGQTAWAAHLLLSYLLADLGCVAESDWLLLGRHALTVGAVASLLATLAVTRPFPWSRRPVETAARSQDASAVATAPQPQVAVQDTERRFLMMVALVLNTMFLFAVVLAGSTSLFVTPCV